MEGTETLAANDMDVLRKMEDEHCRLQRQVRQVQADRSGHGTGVHPVFRRQDHLMRTLKHEYISLCKDLKIAHSGAHKKKDRKMKRDLKQALLVREQTENDCEGGVQIMAELDGLLIRNKKHLQNLKNLVNASQGEIEERRHQSAHRLMSTENALETAMFRFNTVQHENKMIRQEIEHMLRDRANFILEWNKMLKDLRKGKKFLSDLFEASTLAYDQREEWVSKLVSMQDKGKIDQLQQIQEMQDLQKAYDHDTKLFNFLEQKGQIRVNNQQEIREQKEREQELEKTKEKIAEHEKILDDIFEFTQETQCEKIIQNFRIVEQNNFAIYELLTSYCAENEVLRRDKMKIRRDLDDRKDWNEKRTEMLQQKLEKLQAKLDQQRERTQKIRTTVEEKDAILNNTMEKITEIFNMIECSMEPFQNLLGDKQPSLRHLKLSLSLITQRIKELIEIVHYCERHGPTESVKKEKQSSLKKYTTRVDVPALLVATPVQVYASADPCPNCTETRWLSRVTEYLEKPFDRHMVIAAITELASDPTYVMSDRIHALVDCRLPQSRAIFAKRYL